MISPSFLKNLNEIRVQHMTNKKYVHPRAMRRDQWSELLFLTFGKKTLQAGLAMALSRCSGVLAIPQLEFSSKLRNSI